MNWKRALIAVVVVMPIVLLLAYGFRIDPGLETQLTDKPAPPFALEVFAPGQPPIAMKIGDTVHSEALLGKVTVINFWASWCLECRREHADLSSTAIAYANAPVQFLGVLYRDTQKPALAWIEEMGGQAYPSIDDPKARMAIDYGLYGVPETFIVDPKGVIVHKQIGAVTSALLMRWIDSLMPRSATPDTALHKRN